MLQHSKADLPFGRIVINLVTVIDPVLPIILRGVSVDSVHWGTHFPVLGVCSTIRGVLIFFFLLFQKCVQFF